MKYRIIYLIMAWIWGSQVFAQRMKKLYMEK